MIPKKFGPILFAVILSGLMSLLVSGISTYRATGPMPDFVSLWTSAWLTAWFFALPVVMLVAPLTQKVVRLLVADN
jgi:Mn2+/Fe2+ NRAMP family transporter